MSINIVPEDYISVREAAERSDYTRTHIHNLANGNVIKSVMVTDNFRLVSWEDIVAYIEAHPRKQTEPSLEAPL